MLPSARLFLVSLGGCLDKSLFSATLVAVVFLCIEPMARAQGVVGQEVVIKNVTVISPERAAPLLHADVLLRGGRIAEIGANLTPGPGARPINGSGRFLIPGLIDSHVHVGHSAALDDDA